MLASRGPCIPRATQLAVRRSTPGLVPCDGGVFHGTAQRASCTPLPPARTNKQRIMHEARPACPIAMRREFGRPPAPGLALSMRMLLSEHERLA